MKPKLERELQKILRQHNGKSARGNGPASYETQAKRAEILYGGFKTLYSTLNCKIESIFNFREHHMKQLGFYWEGQGIKDIQTRISVFRVFANLWLGKRGMIRESERYVRDPKSVQRRCATATDKTWTALGVDPLELIRRVAELDPRVAMLLELMLAFGLRVKEAMLLRPHLADKKNYLDVSRGAKGGKHRTNEIEKAVQRDTLNRAKTFVRKETSSMIPDGRTFASFRKYFYRICNKAGIGRNCKFKVVPHGLRHEWANAKYKEITGVNSPIKGDDSGNVDKERDEFARIEIAEDLGHSRPAISSAYLGGTVAHSGDTQRATIPERKSA